MMAREPASKMSESREGPVESSLQAAMERSATRDRQPRNRNLFTDISRRNRLARSAVAEGGEAPQDSIQHRITITQVALPDKDKLRRKKVWCRVYLLHHLGGVAAPGAYR
jgi:hypothetical protein